MLKPKLRLWLLILTLIGRLLLVTEVRGQFLVNKKVLVEDVLNGGNWGKDGDYYRLLNPRFVYQKQGNDEIGEEKGEKAEKEYYEVQDTKSEKKDINKEFVNQKISKNKKVNHFYEHILRKIPEKEDESKLNDDEETEYGNDYLPSPGFHYSKPYSANAENMEEYDWKIISEQNKKLKRFVAGFDNIKFIDEHIHAKETGLPAPVYPVNLTQNFRSRHRSNKSKEQFQKLLRKAG